MRGMFYNYSNLEYINLINFTEKSSLNVNNMFDYFPDNIIVCLNENNYKIVAKININCYTRDFSDNWKINKKRK